MAGEDPQESPGGGSEKLPSSPTLQEKPKETDNGKNGSDTASVNVSSARDGNLIAGMIQAESLYTVSIGEFFAEGQGGSESAKLRVQDFWSLSYIELEKTTNTTVCDQTELQRLVGSLLNHRILLLEGAPEIGKRHLATKLASLLGNQGRIEELRRLRSPVSRTTKVNLETLLAKGRIEKSLILIENAFHSGNEDLACIAKDTDSAARDALEIRLRETRSWLILTYDEDRCPDLHPAMLERRERIRGPQAEQLEDFLKSCAVHRLIRDRWPYEEERSRRLDLILEQESKSIVQALGSAPRIERFVVDQLSLALSDTNWTLDRALARAESLESWLIEDIGSDLDALAYVLALTVCHVKHVEQPIRWFQFDALRRSLVEYLRRQLGGEQKEPRHPRELCTEPELMRRLQVEIVGDPEGDLIRFIDDRRAEKIWKSLFGKGRQLAGILVSWLEEVAGHDMYLLRRRAGWVLGLLSQLDHAGICRRLLSIWSQKSSEPRHLHAASLGALVQSAFLSEDKQLSHAVVGWVRILLRGSVVNEVKAGLLCLRDLGLGDLRLAVAEMKLILEKWLLPCLDGLEETDLNLKEKRRAYKKTRSYRLHGDVRRAYEDAFKTRLDLEMARLFPLKAEFRILLAAQHSLIALGLQCGVIALLKELHHWFSAKDGELAPLAALMFLRPRGLASSLDRFLLASSEDKDDTIESSPFLIGLWSEAQGASVLADFLLEVYLGASQLPTSFKHVLVDNWVGLVEGWTRQAARTDLFHEPVMDLWRRLLRAPDLELRGRLNDLLENPEWCVPGTLLGEFVTEIGQRCVPQRAFRPFIS